MNKLRAILQSRALYSFLIVALYLTVVFAMIVPGTASRYESLSSGSDTAAVAKYQVDSTSNFTLSAKILPGTTVRNQTITLENNSEVTVAYNVSVKTTGNLPWIITYDNNTGTIAAGHSSDTITITVQWNSEEKDVALSYEVDLIEIIIECEQID